MKVKVLKRIKTPSYFYKALLIGDDIELVFEHNKNWLKVKILSPGMHFDYLTDNKVTFRFRSYGRSKVLMFNKLGIEITETGAVKVVISEIRMQD